MPFRAAQVVHINGRCYLPGEAVALAAPKLEIYLRSGHVVEADDAQAGGGGDVPSEALAVLRTEDAAPKSLKRRVR